jgi:thiamine kinase-like enzyme
MTYADFMKGWKKNRPQYRPFCRDGILVEEKWEKSSKIMFLLKETHDQFFEIEGRTGGPGGRSPRFWRNMRMWTYIIDEVLEGKKPSFEKVKRKKEESNDSIAYVNLKKYAEQKEDAIGNTNSNDSDIFKYVCKDKKYLLKQIDFIKPHIILCSGTFKYCNLLFENIIQISERLYMVNNIYLIDFWHLSCRKQYKETYKELMKIAKEIKKE